VADLWWGPVLEPREVRWRRQEPFKQATLLPTQFVLLGFRTGIALAEGQLIASVGAPGKPWYLSSNDQAGSSNGPLRTTGMIGFTYSTRGAKESYSRL
jgi:hypothetical protein